MALFSGKLHVQSRLDDTHNLCYQAVNASGYMDQLLFANYVKAEVFPAITEPLNVLFVDGHFSHVNYLLLVKYCRQFFEESGKRVAVFCLPTGQTNHLQPFDVSVFGGIKKRWHDYLASRNVTKDNLCSHLVKLWFRKEGCEERFAFNAGECLTSGFKKCGLFPFSPEIIRATVKAHHDPAKVSRGLLVEQKKKEDQAKLFQVLTEYYGCQSDEDMKKAEESILLIAKGITPGVLAANALQKRVNREAPAKQRRVKNRHLNLEAGKMVSDDEFIRALGKEEAAKAAKKKVDDVGRLAKKKKATEEKITDKIAKVGPSRKRKSAEETAVTKTARKAKKSKNV
ncbi:hypothetical protein RvY_16087 [Ramazzottius varieornatus]|uniref:DDE-1 domain-containing protein n=1 Tax=Ramazzottius varieornatus TaxID=947166 RepID=A0A1D1W1Q5_RAMVA|nr:hypothetical protein RvY_16087 [Ramazzottius varieornatus]